MKALRNLTIVSTIVLSILAFAPGAGAVLIVNELSGSFLIADPAGGSYFELNNGIVLQTDQGNIAGLVLADIVVDVTGWTANGDNVMVTGGTVTFANSANGTTAVFNLSSPRLTQLLISPIGIGYMELDLTPNANNDLAIGTDAVVLPSAMQMVISYNGLVVGNGTASLSGITGSASFLAIPEPASMALLLAGFVFLRKRRPQSASHNSANRFRSSMSTA